MSEQSKPNGKFWIRSTLECAYIAVFLAVVFAVQFALSSIAGVELVTVLFVSYAYVFGVRRSIIAATMFSTLRMILFGFYPSVLILYLLYYSFLCTMLALLGKRHARLWKVVLVATVCASLFTLLDDIITPLYYGFSTLVANTYFYASLPVMGINCACVAVSVGALFVPLVKVFSIAKKRL